LGGSTVSDRLNKYNAGFNMNKARIYVDFNEMVTNDIVLLSKGDTKTDSFGKPITFYDGMPVNIYMEDIDENGNIDNLIASGKAIQYDLGDYGNWKYVKWCCKINENGIIHESDTKRKVKVWFFDGVRKKPPYGERYRPHFVIKGTEDYLGIQFAKLEKTPFAEHIITEVHFIFYGAVDYSKLCAGVEFEIREGSKIVGEGIVIR
jgi:hypothetical protein